MTETTTHAARLYEAAGRFYSQAKPLEYLEGRAAGLATQLREHGSGLVVLEPGNSSRIVLVVTAARTAAQKEALGGDYVVTIPNFHPPRVAVMSQWTDEFAVGEHLQLLSGDVPFVAIVLMLAFEAVRS